MDAAIVAKLDRLGRDSIDLQVLNRDLASAGVDLSSEAERLDTSCAAGKFAFQMYCALAELERNRCSERCKDARKQQRRDGRHMGGDLPFGWAKGPGNVLVAREDEQATLALAFDMVDGMERSAAAAAGELNKRGMHRRNGKDWIIVMRADDWLATAIMGEASA